MAGGLDVPAEYMALVNVAGVIVAIGVAAWQYARSLSKEPKPSTSTEVQVVGGALADRGAMERLAASIDRVGDLLEDLMEQQERHHAADDLATVHRRLDDFADLRRAMDELARRIPPGPPP